MKSFQTPLAFKASLEQRLRTRSQKTGTDLHRLRQLVIYERFLTRVFQIFGDDAVLKGGVVLELRLESARATKDIDLNLRGQPESILERLREAGRLDLNDFLSFEITLDEKSPDIQAEGLRYGGIRFKSQAFLAGKVYGSRYGVDVALADFNSQAETIRSPSFLEFADVEPSVFRVYPVELHIAEKFHAYTLPRTTPNSRVKDLPDIALLATLRELELTKVRDAIRLTFSKRKTHPLPDAFAGPPDFWESPYARLASSNRLPWKNLEDVWTAGKVFLEPALSDGEAIWNPEEWAWHSTDQSDPR